MSVDDAIAPILTFGRFHCMKGIFLATMMSQGGSYKRREVIHVTRNFGSFQTETNGSNDSHGGSHYCLLHKVCLIITTTTTTTTTDTLLLLLLLLLLPGSVFFIVKSACGRCEVIIGCLLTRARMEEFEVVLFLCSLCIFTAWLSFLQNKLSRSLDTIDDSTGELEEIRAAVEMVGQILNQLPEILKSGVPEFHMNTNPLQPIFEAIARNLSGEQPLKTYEAPTGPDGRYIGTQTEETDDTT